MAEYPRTLPATIPADKNAQSVAVASGWDASREVVVPIGTEQLLDGSWALKTTAAISLSVSELEITNDAGNPLPTTVIGSTQAFFSDNISSPLGVTFAGQTFGFNSFSITLTNDEGVTGGYIEYSFNGSQVHGRLLNGEGFAHDFQRQPAIWLRGQAGGEKYRLGAY